MRPRPLVLRPALRLSTKSTHFGFQEIQEHEKKQKVGEVFHRVASNYDLMNDVMSTGVHRLWKEYFVKQLNPKPGMKLIDVAGGTGDISFRFLEHARLNRVSKAQSFIDDVIAGKSESFSPTIQTCSFVCDINESMLRVGVDRARKHGYNVISKLPSHESCQTPDSPDSDSQLVFQVEDAETLSLPTASFDAYTIAFGLRNVTRPQLALQEAYRVLKKGGRFMCLEFSHIENPIVSQIYDLYSFNAIPALGELIVGDRSSYQYLVESIRRFPKQKILSQMMREAGFQCVTYENLTMGAVAIHSGFKL